MVVNGKDEASLVARLQQENKALRSQLEEQYRQAIKLAETIQMVHLARLKEAAKDMHQKITPASPPEDFQQDLASTSAALEGQQHEILNSRQQFAAQAEQLRTLEDRARKWAKKYLHKIKAAACKAESAAGIPSPAPGSGAGATVASPAGSQSVLEQRTSNSQADSAPVPAIARQTPAERTPAKCVRNSETSDIRTRPVGRQPVPARPVSRSVSRTPESSRGVSRSRLMDPIGGRANGRASEPPRRSASRPAESSSRSIHSAVDAGRRSASRPAESTTRSYRTTDSVRRSISRPVEGTLRSQSRPAETRPTRSANRLTAESVRRSVSSRPAESTRSVSTARSAPRPGSSTATSSWRAPPSERSPGADARKTSQRSDTGPAAGAPPESAARRAPPSPDPQPRAPDTGSAEQLQDAAAREAQQREQQQREAEERVAEQRAGEQRAAEQLAAEQRAAEQLAAEQRAAKQLAAEQRAAKQLAAEQRAAEQRAAEQRAAAAARSPQPAQSPQRPYSNGASPASPVVDLSATNGAKNPTRPSPVHSQHGASPVNVPARVPAADGVAEALQGSQMDSATIIQSVNQEKRVARSMSSVSEPYPPPSLATNIRTNQMYQSIDVHDSVAEELLSATYASDTASMMSTMTGQEKVWAGASVPKKKKGTRTTFLNRLFSSKKNSE